MKKKEHIKFVDSDQVISLEKGEIENFVKEYYNEFLFMTKDIIITEEVSNFPQFLGGKDIIIQMISKYNEYKAPYVEINLYAYVDNIWDNIMSWDRYEPIEGGLIDDAKWID
jgi:hypothetical protein